MHRAISRAPLFACAAATDRCFERRRRVVRRKSIAFRGPWRGSAQRFRSTCSRPRCRLD